MKREAKPPVRPCSPGAAAPKAATWCDTMLPELAWPAVVHMRVLSGCRYCSKQLGVGHSRRLAGLSADLKGAGRSSDVPEPVVAGHFNQATLLEPALDDVQHFSFGPTSRYPSGLSSWLCLYGPSHCPS